MADICHECENPAWTGRTIEAPALPSGGEGGTSNFNALDNRPKYDGVRMTGNTDIPNVSRDIERLDGDVEDIQGLIPETATPENQLADKDFVNSSVATNTANFVGTYNSLEELEAVENPSNNDYGFVISTDEQGNTVFNRYKYVSSVESWEFEYALNNSSFTAVQWAAINSGVTEGNVEKINAILEIKSVGNGLVLENNGQLRQKLYTETGNNTDAAMDQKTVSEELDKIYGAARVLTEADYNANSSDWSDTDPANFNCIAFWKLSDGLYSVQSDTIKNKIKVAKTATISSWISAMTIKGLYLIHRQDNGAVHVHVFGPSGDNDGTFGFWAHRTATVLVNGNMSNIPNSVLVTAQVVDNLFTEAHSAPLSAAQGKALAERIGTLSNLNTTDKTNTVAAINEVAGYKGQARVLTTDDYNWNTTTNTTTGELNAVALWLLPPGFYVWGRDSNNQPKIMANVNEELSGYGLLGALVLSQTSNLNQVGILAIGQGGSAACYYSTRISNGTQVKKTFFLTRDSIIDNLVSTSAANPLSANQGRILKGLIDGKQDKLTAGNGIEIDNENVISIATISTEDWSALWQ